MKLKSQSRLDQVGYKAGQGSAISSQWTARDLDIVESLALKTRMLTSVQVGRIWWCGCRRSEFLARRRLHRICQAGLLEKVRVNLHPLLDLKTPVFAWNPGQASPDCEKIAYQVQQRWTRPATPTSVYVASRRARSLFASYGGKPIEPVQATHDVHMGQVYAHYRLDRPADAQLFVGEDSFGKAGFQVKDPDAFLIEGNGQVTCLVEFAGKYSADRIRAFHSHASELNVRYELW